MAVCKATGRGGRFQDLSGQRFGRWTVIEFIGVGPTRWLCKCDCGVVRSVEAGNLKKGVSVSCGCFAIEGKRARKLRHGRSGTTMHIIWSGMKSRCYNKNEPAYKNYGGRGIRMCDRWRNSFEAFLEDVGERPGPEYSIDRIDNDGNYEPGNVRWVTDKQQANNKRNNRILEHDGRSLTVAQWAKETGISGFVILGRLSRGWTVHDALTLDTLPIGGKRGR